MQLRDTPAAELMRQANDAPDRPSRRGVPVQFQLDKPTAAIVAALAAASRPVLSVPEWHREAVREKIERDTKEAT